MFSIHSKIYSYVKWGCPLPSRLGGLGERRKLPQRDPGRSPRRKRVLMRFELDRTHLDDLVIRNFIIDNVQWFS